MTWTRLTAVLIALLLAFALPRPAEAQGKIPPGSDKTLSATARWQPMSQDRPGYKEGAVEIVVPLGEALTDKQRNMIEGGFTTVSQLSLKLPLTRGDERNDADLPVFHSVRCSVKFDAWEEIFDIARLDDQPLTTTVKEYGDYGAICLKAHLDNPNLLARLSLQGGVILAYLVVKQTSVEEAQRIKDWLVQQQSGVMQSLFSHMLGELTLSQTLRVRVIVPPRPKEGQPHGGVEEPIKPADGSTEGAAKG